MDRDERIDISGSVGAGDGGTTEQLRYFTDAVLNDTAIDLPAANFEEAIKTMTIAEETLNATPDDMSAQLKAMIAASEAGAQGAWRGDGDGEGEGVAATAERLARPRHRQLPDDGVHEPVRVEGPRPLLVGPAVDGAVGPRLLPFPPDALEGLLRSRRRLQQDAVRAVDDVHGRVERATQIFEPGILGAEAVQRHAVRLLDLLHEDVDDVPLLAVRLALVGRPGGLEGAGLDDAGEGHGVREAPRRRQQVVRLGEVVRLQRDDVAAGERVGKRRGRGLALPAPQAGREPAVQAPRAGQARLPNAGGPV